MYNGAPLFKYLWYKARHKSCIEARSVSSTPCLAVAPFVLYTFLSLPSPPPLPLLPQISSKAEVICQTQTKNVYKAT